MALSPERGTGDKRPWRIVRGRVGEAAQSAGADAEAEARRLVQTYADTVLRVSYTYLRSTADAEDICQTVLLKLVESPRAFENAEHERAWVVRAAINASKDALRGAYRRTSVPLDAAADTADSSPAPDAPHGSEVLDAVMRLDEKYREAIYLHYYEGYSIREIAELTGRTQTAVGAHLSRGRAKPRGRSAMRRRPPARRFRTRRCMPIGSISRVARAIHTPRAPCSDGHDDTRR